MGPAGHPLEPPLWLPVISHRHLIAFRAPHVSLMRQASVPTLVASSPAAAEVVAVMRTHDHALASIATTVHLRTHTVQQMHGRGHVAFSAYGLPLATGKEDHDDAYTY
jgi:hypothetical protein